MAADVAARLAPLFVTHTYDSVAGRFATGASIDQRPAALAAAAGEPVAFEDVLVTSPDGTQRAVRIPAANCATCCSTARVALGGVALAIGPPTGAGLVNGGPTVRHAATLFRGSL